MEQVHARGLTGRLLCFTGRASVDLGRFFNDRGIDRERVTGEIVRAHGYEELRALLMTLWLGETAATRTILP
jgi:hypothetical protein